MAIRIVTDIGWLDQLSPRIESFFRNNRVAYFIEGKIIQGYRCPDGYGPLWLRDHVHQMKAFRYWEPDMTSALDYFAGHQAENGRVWDCFDWRPADVSSTKAEMYYDPKNRIRHVRCPCESDVEYLLVFGTHLVWQATGDDAWLKAMLPRLERALRFITSDPQHWDAEHQLVKRLFTLDTWDFTYHRLTDKYCIMHGDNSGYYRAFCLMADFCAHFGDTPGAAAWREKAEGLRERTNRLCWNGRFYTHQVHLDPVEVPGVDEGEILSLSNPYDINRGLSSHNQAAGIIREYRRRRQATAGEYFAEWFSIHPPIPDFAPGDNWSKEPGNYVNGGVMPLVGGELARACFEHGFEEYGLDILKRYSDLIERDNASFLWYHPNGEHGISPATSRSLNELILRTDGWGSSAFVYALTEGLAGVEDRSKLFQDVRLSPRWIAAGTTRAEVALSYPVSGAGAGYTFTHDPDNKVIRVAVNGAPRRICLHLLLPAGTKPKSVKNRDCIIPFRANRIETSVYVDAETTGENPDFRVEYQSI